MKKTIIITTTILSFLAINIFKKPKIGMCSAEREAMLDGQSKL